LPKKPKESVMRWHRYLVNLPESQKRSFFEKTEKIRYKYKTIEKLFKIKGRIKSQALDNMFFEFEELPIFGKEYWFMKFTSTDTETKKQLLIMFGRPEGKMKVNNSYVKNEKLDHNTLKGAIVCWFYDEEAENICDSVCNITISENQLISKSGDIKCIFSGNYPDYELKLTKRGDSICRLKIFEPDDNSPKYEISKNFKSLFGIECINSYLNFKGSLNSEDFEGKCFVQKVIVVGPLVPWRWGRIIFKNGSILYFFLPQLQAFGFKYDISSELMFYDSDSDRIYKINDLEVSEYGKKETRWVISSKKNNMIVIAKSYSMKPITLESMGNLTYLEYLAEITDFYIETEDKVISLKDLGSGIGLIENAYGYVI
ncbi:MAG: hypothetical protein U9Q92_00900, partial [archaeon]|nr:hypothetical protein [archaeon]